MSIKEYQEDKKYYYIIFNNIEKVIKYTGIGKIVYTGIGKIVVDDARLLIGIEQTMRILLKNDLLLFTDKDRLIRFTELFFIGVLYYNHIYNYEYIEDSIQHLNMIYGDLNKEELELIKNEANKRYNEFLKYGIRVNEYLMVNLKKFNPEHKIVIPRNWKFLVNPLDDMGFVQYGDVFKLPDAYRIIKNRDIILEFIDKIKESEGVDIINLIEIINSLTKADKKIVKEYLLNSKE